MLAAWRSAWLRDPHDPDLDKKISLHLGNSDEEIKLTRWMLRGHHIRFKKGIFTMLGREWLAICQATYAHLVEGRDPARQYEEAEKWLIILNR